jgi:hypothetical protein
MFRRPPHSSELVSLAVRTVGSARAFDRGISKIPSNCHGDHQLHFPSNRYGYDGHHHNTYPSPLLSLKPIGASTSGPHERLLKLSTAKLSAAQNLLKGVESEIETLQKNLDEFHVSIYLIVVPFN